MEFMPAAFAQHVAELNPVRVGRNLKTPTKVRDVRPAYPPIARDSHVQGVVILETIIDDTGAVIDTRILRSIPLLDQAALDAVRQWRYTPSTYGGRPVSVLMTITVRFTLQQ